MDTLTDLPTLPGARPATQAKALLEAHGLPCPVVSYGSSPGIYFARSLAGITESRAGVYPFQDLFQACLGACAIDDVALSVLATVTGRQPALNRLLIDAGGLALSKDRSTQGTAFDELETGALIPAGHDLYSVVDGGLQIVARWPRVNGW